MTEDKAIKKYPVTTGEVAKMLGLPSAAVNLPLGTFTPKTGSLGDLPIANLPIGEVGDRKSEAGSRGSENGDKPKFHKPANYSSAAGHRIESLNQQQAKQSAAFRIGKVILPYAAIFTIGLFLYYFFFTGVDFGSIFKSLPKAATTKESLLQQLEKQNLQAYQTWISGFYYDVQDAKIVDPETDNSGNGLSNFQKYLLNLNPKAYDTLGLGQADSQALAMGINPLTGLSLTQDQKSVVDKYVDLEVASNRLALNRLQQPERVAGVNTNNSGTAPGVINPQPSVSGTPRPPVNTGADLNFASSNPNDWVVVNIQVAGRLEIPSLKINAPIIWSKQPASFENDLRAGVIHYPGTAMPGQIGTTYISGHSSNYLWAKGEYNTIFSHLGDLADNTSVKITVVQKNGKDAFFHYVVTGRKEYSPTDQKQFENSGKSVVALSTCWPVGSTAKRLVVFAELTQVEK